MADVLSHPRFQDEQAAYDWVEAHLWPVGPVCPRCTGSDRITKLQGKSTRIGTYKCNACRKPFTVKIGTIFEDSHISMRLWLQAISLLCASKKGISSNQLHRMLGITLKSAWFMSHRIREAMRSGGFATPMGGADGSGVVEADETFIGRKKGMPKPKGGHAHKHAVLSLVERGGEVRSVHVPDVKAKTVLPIVNANISKEARIMTDDSSVYYKKIKGFASHATVNHVSGEYVRYENGEAIHTNTVESCFSIFKRGMKGTYQHCGEQHLHRYIAEFDFRHNNRIALDINDEKRSQNALEGVKGKRLTYRTTSGKVSGHA